MAHRVCTNCGGPLGADARACEFCGVEQAPDPPRAPVVVERSASPNPNAGRAVGLLIAGVAMVVGVAIAVSAGRRTSTPATPEIKLPAIPNVDLPFSAKAAYVPLSALHTTHIDWTSSVPIDPSGIVGTLAKLDVLANWDWALGVGRAWWSDAEIYDVSADPIEKDGTANVTVESARVEYHFVSKACRKDHAKRAETEKNVKDESCSLELTIDKSGPNVRLDLIAVDSGGSSHPLAKPACSIAQVFEHLEKNNRLTKRPAYRIRLDHDVFGLSYTVGNGSSAASMDPIDVSPSFCGAKAATASTATPPRVETQPSSRATSEGPPFDRGAVLAALRKVDVSSCKALAGPAGNGHVVVTFGTDGSATSSRVDGALAGTDKGNCVQKAYATVKVPPFSGSPTTVGMSVAL